MPEVPQRPEDWLSEVRRSEQEGELFHAYDLARQGLEQFPYDRALQHRAVLLLASTGARRQATELIEKFGLYEGPGLSLRSRLGLDVAALHARLMKDNALASTGNARGPALAAAAAKYADIYRRAIAAGNAEAYYPGVNAATLSLLAGEEANALALGDAVLRQLAAWPADRRSYYEVASELEAQLVIGDLDGAQKSAEALRTTIRNRAQSDYRGLSSTIRQLRLLIEARGLGPEWQEALAPPRVIHFLGHMIAPQGQAGRFPAEQEKAVKSAIAAALALEDVGFGYGSLAAGADILFAEALLECGASVHVILPFERDDFIDVSVRPSGEGWIARFHECLRRSATVRYATEDRYLGDDHLFDYCSQLAMGLALLRARHLSTSVGQIAVWDGSPPAGPAGTAADVAQWRRTGMPQKIIPVGGDFHPGEHAPEARRVLERRTRAMLFGDIHGFSRLTDAQLPHFIGTILGTVSRVVESCGADILLANTWGDGLFLVFDDAGKAASCALALQEGLGAIDKKAAGLPEDMALRVGLHLGPAYTARDPILQRDNFFGAHVSRAARIEPVTPLGCVYVTETMAAVLALHNADEFTCEYVGMTRAAKNYGQMRMFLLSRKPDM